MCIETRCSPKEMSSCLVEGCDRPVKCRGYCNAHHLRFMMGKDLSVPIGYRVRGRGTCSKCSKFTFGSGLCKTHWQRQRYADVWEALFDEHGRGCLDCGVEYPPSVYDFHHLDPKEKSFAIGQGITDRSIEATLAESRKCVMLCSNCHRLRHLEERNELRKSTEFHAET